MWVSKYTFARNIWACFFYGGHEKGIDGIIKGTKSIEEFAYENKDKNTFKKDTTGHTDIHTINTDKHSNSSSITKDNKNVNDFNTLCWTCSNTQVKLYKCGGCHKARYCSEQCILQ